MPSVGCICKLGPYASFCWLSINIMLSFPRVWSQFLARVSCRLFRAPARMVSNPARSDKHQALLQPGFQVQVQNSAQPGKLQLSAARSICSSNRYLPMTLWTTGSLSQVLVMESRNWERFIWTCLHLQVFLVSRSLYTPRAAIFSKMLHCYMQEHHKAQPRTQSVGSAPW